MLWLTTGWNFLTKNFTTILVVACAFLFMQWRDAEDEADAARKLAAAQVAVAESQSRISEHAEQTDNTTRVIVRTIMESPHANTPIPDDIADAYYAGIDKLRNDNGYTDESATDMPRSSRGDAGKSNDRDSALDVDRTRVSLLAV